MQFLAASRLVIVAGKGGVGKTTVTAALATAAASAGLRTLALDVEGRGDLAAALGVAPGPAAAGADEVVVGTGTGPDGRGELRTRTVAADRALAEYLDDHGLRRVTGRLVRTGVLDLVATAAPGIADLLVLGKVKQLERSGAFDLVVLDAPAAGHAVSFLQSPRGLLDAVSGGPVHAQARDVLALLGDPARCRVVLVTVPEETPVNEAVETAYALEDRVGLALGPVVVNGVWPVRDLDPDPAAAAARAGVVLAEPERRALAEAAAFRRARQDLQQAQLARLGERLPLPQLRLPWLFEPRVGRAEVAHLADALRDAVAQLPDQGP